jgi:hypothetical protein
MDRVIIGSSNVYRFYRPELYKDFKTYNVARCTDLTTFKAIMENLGVEETGVVVSVLENFLERSIVGETETEALLEGMGNTMTEFMKIVRNAASRLPNSKFILADPIKRPKCAPYQEHFEDILLAFGEGFDFRRMDNITRMEGIAEGCQQFEPDEVHLTAASGQIFIEGLLTKAEIFFTAPLVNLDSELNENEESSITDKLTQRLDLLETRFRTRQDEDNMIFARLREEMDAATNKQKEDKIVITGITSNIYPPADLSQKKLWLRNIVEDVIKTMIPDFPGKILHVNQGKNLGKMIPLVEVRLDSASNANLIRKAFAEKKKSNADIGRIFIANSVNLATRVRVDILKALARKITDQQTIAYAVPFVSRPVLQIRAKESGSTAEARSFSFTDAVAKYGHLLKQFELADAYRRAGSHFKGQLEQQFLVLKEKKEGERIRGGGANSHRPRRGHFGHESGSRKRVREEEDEDDWSRESPSRGRPYSRASGSGARRPFRGNKIRR